MPTTMHTDRMAASPAANGGTSQAYRSPPPGSGDASMMNEASPTPHNNVPASTVRSGRFRFNPALIRTANNNALTNNGCTSTSGEVLNANHSNATPTPLANSEPTHIRCRDNSAISPKRTVPGPLTRRAARCCSAWARPKDTADSTAAGTAIQGVAVGSLMATARSPGCGPTGLAAHRPVEDVRQGEPRWPVPQQSTGPDPAAGHARPWRESPHPHTVAPARHVP